MSSPSIQITVRQANHLEVMDGMEFGRQTTMYAQELLVHYSSQRKRAK